ncbi:hypothetical protein FRUB_07056 [Fimbriiglobus ruber]|uniref:Uncharacterized protein n=1 Tax=Fimbriiglobus ruber TaxID=1908690 RepID=A0A225DKF4_9BACT|nr:hypothetical protein FRUB_07056 [Fimbriiglobus ruber]
MLCLNRNLFTYTKYLIEEETQLRLKTWQSAAIFLLTIFVAAACKE